MNRYPEVSGLPGGREGQVDDVAVGQGLIQRGYVTREAVRNVWSTLPTGRRLGQELVRRGLINTEQLAEVQGASGVSSVSSQTVPAEDSPRPRPCSGRARRRRGSGPTILPGSMWRWRFNAVTGSWQRTG